MLYLHIMMRRLFVITVLLNAALLAACNEKRPGRTQFPFEEITEGDLAFRCGRGIFSRAVLSADGSSVYSHVGIVVREGERWKVVHAVPGERESSRDFDRVKKEDLEIFFSHDKAYRGCLVHTGLPAGSSVCKDALDFARDSIPFDNRYELEDSSAVYCTEFVWLLYRRAGIDLTEGRRREIHAFHVDGPLILPEHILQYSGNTEYYKY